MSKSTEELFPPPMPTSIVHISNYACGTCSLLCWSSSHFVTKSKDVRLKKKSKKIKKKLFIHMCLYMDFK